MKRRTNQLNVCICICESRPKGSCVELGKRRPLGLSVEGGRESYCVFCFRTSYVC